jgi:phosphatidylinositol alpha-1,6-mannosyltransferase
VVVQSEWTRKKLEQHLPNSDLRVIPPSAPDIAAPSEQAKDAVREQLSIPTDAPVVVYPGDLEFSRGSQHFAQLVEALGKEQPDTVFVYACREKTPAAAGIATQLKQRLSDHNVRFAGELASLLPLLDLGTFVAFPTDSAFGKVDIPIALLEAMRLGVPVLSFDFGPLVELGGTVQVPLDDSGALLEAARSLLSNAGERVRVAREQSAFLRQNLDPQHAADAYEQIYRETLNLD